MIKKENSKKNTSKLKSNILTCTYLYLFMLIMPFIITGVIDINLNINRITITIISFLYSILSFVLTIFTYKKFNRLKDKDFNERTVTFKKGLLVIFLYFFTSLFEAVPLLLIVKDPSTLSLTIKIVYLIIYEIIQVLLIIYIFKDELIKCIQDIKENHKSYFSMCVKYYLGAIIIMMASNLIISLINSGNIAGNEESIRELFGKAPFYTYFSAVIIAPILEELTFRQGIRSIFSNDKLFIIISGLVFGGLHVIGNINSPIDILYLIPYSIPGIAFAIMLKKTDNVLVPMGFHFFHNGITMSLQLLLMFFGA